jgi:hypothetical protein
MKTSDGTPDDTEAARVEFKAALARIDSLRIPLLNVHKALLEQERTAYEVVHGRVEGQGTFLNLLMTDPWFDWLHRISQMVVRIDELSEAKPEAAGGFPVLAQSAQNVLQEAQAIFRPIDADLSAKDRDFISRYKATLQRSSAAVFAHGELLKVLFQTE